MVSPTDVLGFWLDDVGPAGWYDQSDALDTEIKERFLPTWEKAAQGGHSLWLTHPTGVLAYLIVTDQFSRNMFRGSGKSFATDKAALAAAKIAVAKKWDMRIDEPARQFFYMPLMHSESLCDQERCIRLICERMPEGRDNQLLHARAHREVIRQFGRFPYRNDALQRAFTKEEQSYVKSGGYGTTLRMLEAA